MPSRQSDGCLVWRDAPIGQELAVAPEPAPGTSCVPTSFRRFSQAEACALLSRRRLLLLGDSVMSYCYLSLAYFLHSGDTLKTWNAHDRGHELPLFEPLRVLPDGVCGAGRACAASSRSRLLAPHGVH